MPITKIPLIGVSATGRSPDLNSHRAINLMPQAGTDGAKDSIYWVATPGLSEYGFDDTTGMVSKAYALYSTLDTLFIVNRNGSNYEMRTSDGSDYSSNILTLTSYQGGRGFWANTADWVAFVGGTAGTPVYVTDGTAGGSSIATYFSSELAVTAIENISSTTYQVTTAVDHELGIGDEFIIKGSTNFNDTVYTVTDITTASPTIFEFTHTNSTDADETNLIDAYAYAQTSANGTIAFITITSLDTYFIANTTTNVYVSYPNDPRIWVPTNDFSASRDPDLVWQVFAFGGLVYIFGDTTLETYYNGGQGTQPFVPSRPIAYNWGLAALGTVSILGDGLAWLGRRKSGGRSVVRLSGGAITPITNAALEYHLNRSLSGDAYAYSYMDERGEFYQISFVVSGGSTYVTWCYDLATSSKIGVSAWHERQDSSGARHRGKFYAYLTAGGGHILADHTLSELLVMDVDDATEVDGSTAASTVDRTGYSGHISIEGRGAIHHSVFIDMENPVGTGTVTLQWSDDGGNNYNTGVTKSFTGRGTRVEFFGLGFSRYDRVYKLTFNDCTVPVNVIGAYANVEPCSL